jgi:UDP-N-acetylmuramate dehydrogenase
MEILRNYDLTKLNTFGIPARAKFLAEVKSEQDFLELIQTPEFKNNEKLFLGGGSNVLFTKDFDGIVILNKLRGIEIIKENAENVWLKAMGGEWWNDLVLFSVEKGFWGIENLSLVPGTVGAAPVQNIGAYGAEVKDNLEEVEVLDIKTGQKKILSKKECAFGYRDSVFKNKLKGKYFIIAVVFKLSKKKNKNTNYEALQDYLTENKIEIKNSKDVSEAIANIRRSKLPDPKILGNAGSFFKNVYVDIDKLLEIELKYPGVPSFEEGDMIKIPTGWLIEQCGWKGKKIGNVGVHAKQALVLVNYGGATGKEILALANQIIDSVYQKFGLKLIPEVNLI